MNTNNHPLLEFKNVTVMRGKNKAVHNINLKIEAGENVAIIGPNGSGKSTFIKCITKECYPIWNSKSCIKVFGESFWDVFELRKMLGIVSSDLQLMCRKELTALDENIICCGITLALVVIVIPEPAMNCTVSSPTATRLVCPATCHVLNELPN